MKHVCKLAALAVMGLCCLHLALAQDYEYEEGEDWQRYSSLSLSFPFVNNEFDGDDGDAACDFDSNGVGFDYQAHHVSPTGFTVLARCGFSYISGDLEADYGGYEGADTLEDINGFFTYFKLGFGYAFQLLDRHLAIIPTAGLGFTMDLLYCEYDTEEEYYNYYYGYYYMDDSDYYFGVDFTVDLFFNLMAAFMFTENFGLSASCEVSMNAFGFGGATDMSAYAIDFGTFSFMPAVGVCLRF